MSFDDYEKEFSTEAQFDNHITGLVGEWQKLGIDPDDFLKCTFCKQWMYDVNNHFGRIECCQNTQYLVRTANDIDYARVEPWQGGFQAAERVAAEIKGYVLGLDEHLCVGSLPPLADLREK